MALLELTRVSKSFGGLRANRDISFQVAEGELVSLIGPNGAGKSTIFNCIAGHYPPTSGRIVFNGQDITNLPANEVARRGLARTFQVYTATGDLNVVENVMVGAFMNTKSHASARSKAEQVLDMLKLRNLAHHLVAELPVDAQKLVTMATAVATEPKMLLLDEVAAGLNHHEIEEIIKSIRFIHEKLKITIMLIEHVMTLVMGISDRIVVLDAGQKIAEGVPEEVVHAPQVIQAYLGERYAKRRG